MTSATHNNGSVSLRQYLESLMESYKAAHAREHALLEQAVNHTKEAMEYRLAGMNEFRDQIQDERAKLVTLDKFDANLQSLQKQIEINGNKIVELEKYISRLNGKIAGAAAVIGAVFVLVQIALRYWGKG